MADPPFDQDKVVLISLCLKKGLRLAAKPPSKDGSAVFRRNVENMNQ